MDRVFATWLFLVTWGCVTFDLWRGSGRIGKTIIIAVNTAIIVVLLIPNFRFEQ